jgi:hypothetical protein
MGDPTDPKPSARQPAPTDPDPVTDSVSDPGDPTALAERFLDLWQDQLGAIATDADLAELVARMWSQWLVGPAAWRPAATEAPARPAARARSRAPQQSSQEADEPRAQTPGAAPAAAPSRDHGPDVGDLLARLGTLEKRLAALERPARVSRGPAERRTRRR